MKFRAAYMPFALCQCILGVGLYFFTSPTATAQNLVPNPGFEEYIVCPYPIHIGGPMPCAPWVSITSTADYFNACSPFPTSVPVNFQGYQYANNGDGYIGGYQQTFLGCNGIELCQVQLYTPLRAAQCYYVSMYINLSNQSCGINQLSALFTQTPTIYNMGYLTPQVSWSGQFYSDTVNWVNLSGTFIAVGGEEYLTIGNLLCGSQTQFDPTCPPAPPGTTWAYYYFDDVLVEQTTTNIIPVDLGGPYEDCEFVVLDPQIPNVSYYWSDGSTESSLLVTTSGIYSVVVYTDGCYAGVDSVEVTILGAPSVYLGPDITLCPGDLHTITLDELAGDYLWSDGSEAAQFTISAGGIYSVTLDDGCDISWDQIEVTMLQPPAFTLGDDALLCPGDELVITLEPSLGNFLWQDNSTASTYTIESEGTYSVTVTNPCGVHEDEIVITSIDPPVFSLGADSTILCEGDSLEFHFDANLGEFMWQDGSTLPDYIITGTGLYGLTVTNPCGLHSGTINVQEISEPVVTLEGTLLLCPGETETLSAGNNFGDIQWQDGSTESEYIVTTTGIYGVTVTNACGVDSGFVQVYLQLPVIPPDLGPDISLCPGEQLVFEINQPGTSILWSDFSTGNSLAVTSSGTYFVQVSSICESFSDTVVVIVQNSAAPDIQLPDDFALCEGQTVVLDGGTVMGAYLWSDGSQSSQLAVSAPGLYTLTVTNNCGTGVDSVWVTDGGPAPLVNLGMDTSICSGQSIDLVPSFQHVTTWTWMDGSSDPFFTATTPGLVFIEAANACGVTHDTVMIQLLPDVPTFSLGQDTAICPGESVTLSISIPDVDILWHDGSDNDDLIVSDSATVIAFVSNVCGISSDTVHVELLSEVPILDLGPDQTLCPGEVITIDPGIPNVIYTWQDGSSVPQFQTAQEGTIILVISNSCGSASDTMEITESTDGPQLDLGPDLMACAGETITIPSGISGVQYLWQDGSTLHEFVTSVSGTYTLTVYNLCGMDMDTIEVILSGLPPVAVLGPDTTLCEGHTLLLSSSGDPASSVTWQDGSTALQYEVVVSGTYVMMETNECGMDSDTIEVLIHGLPPLPDLGSDTALCEGATLLLMTHADPMTDVTWQDGSTGLTFLVSSPGLYILSESNRCGEAEDSIMVRFESAPALFDLGPDTTLCPGESFIVFAPPTSDEIFWQDGSNLPFIMVEVGTTYVLSIQNECGVASDSFSVSFDAHIPVVDIKGPLPWCKGDSILLDATQVFPVSYSWNTGEITPSVVVVDPGYYVVEIAAPCVTTTHAIDVVPSIHCLTSTEFYIPNIFSPNGDQVNDYFSVFPVDNSGLQALEGSIFDRWGNLLFTSSAIPFIWDGYSKGERMLPGVYLYVIKATFNAGGSTYEKVFSGDVTLIR